MTPDRTVKDALRLDWGFWKSKDEYDILDEEIERKLEKGYPDDNILFEDSRTAVLIQAGQETSRVSMGNAEALDGIINAFINYIRPEVKDFREAMTTFQSDLPTILESLRDLIAEQSKKNQNRKIRNQKFDSRFGATFPTPVTNFSQTPEITTSKFLLPISQHRKIRNQKFDSRFGATFPTAMTNFSQTPQITRQKLLLPIAQ